MKLFSILPHALTELHNNKLEAKQANFDLATFINKRQDPYVKDGIGYVNIYGALLRDSAPIDTLLGNTDYEDIINDCNMCLESGAKVIIFDIDSPGGTCAGAIETAEFIRDLPVPSVGFVSGLCCSAAYQLASGMTHLVASKSTSNGNIGAIIAYTDTSKMLDAAGVEVKPFTSEGAEFKSIGYGASLTEAQVAFLQESIDEAGKQFRDFVTENRTVDPIVFKAGWYGGEKSLELGLIDQVGNADDALEYANALAQRFSV